MVEFNFTRCRLKQSPVTQAIHVMDALGDVTVESYVDSEGMFKDRGYQDAEAVKRVLVEVRRIILPLAIIGQECKKQNIKGTTPLATLTDLKIDHKMLTVDTLLELADLLFVE